MVLLLLAACDPEKPLVLTDCVIHDHCAVEDVCFLSACVDPGSSTAEVFADVVPANTSEFLPQVDRLARELSTGLRQNVSLRASVQVTGTVTANGEARLGFLQLTSIPDGEAPGLPSATHVTKALVDDEGFSVQLRSGTDFAVSFTPNDTSRPPVTWSAPISIGEEAETVDLEYPADASMIRVTGVVQAEPGVPSSFKTGVLVEGTGNPGSDNPARSTTALTGDGGAYSLTFPPGISVFRITVRPGVNPAIPVAERDLILVTPPSGGNPGELEPFVLDLLPGAHTVTTVLRGNLGDPVAKAAVSFFGDPVGRGTFDVSEASGVNGTLAVTLLPGLYTVAVAPEDDDLFAYTTQTVCVADPGDVAAACGDGVNPPDPMPLVVNHEGTIEITVRDKIEIAGTVTSVDGFTVADADLSLRLRNARVTRSFSTSTGAFGNFSLLIDPGSALANVTYDLTIVPMQTSDLPLPRYQETVSVGTAALQTLDVTFYDAALIFGRVATDAGEDLADARISFYSVELGSATEPQLVGLGQTNDLGEYVIPIPTAAEP